MTAFNKILIANRGEIALRVIRTAREMGIRTVAVYSEVDRGSLHVRQADEAYSLGKPQPAESYLNIDKLLAVAKKSGAEAVHPGYGFLSENAAFAQRCEDEGIVFIGPTSDNIRVMGDKIAARRALEGTDAPLIPGTRLPAKDADAMVEGAEQIGYPVMVKAVGGGGGRGIRVANNEDELRAAFAVATSEANTAFGNAQLYLEKFLRPVRHIEVQILADQYGNTIHLGERECSIQRRRQKLIEETPCQFITHETRHAICDAAVSICQAIAYRGAGTVEFVVDGKGDFYFLEMNTRLQVEHPVTEAVTGIDLVREQIRIARGETLSIPQAQTRPRGAAMEVRVYAEDAAAGFAPSVGTIRNLNLPSGPNVRVDAGLFEGLEVSLYYDALIAKVIVRGPSRDVVIRRMRRALNEFTISGIRTTIPVTQTLLKREDFGQGEFYTEYLEQLLADGELGLKDTKNGLDKSLVAVLAAAVSQHERAGKWIGALAESTGQGGVLQDPWQSTGHRRQMDGGRP